MGDRLSTALVRAETVLELVAPQPVAKTIWGSPAPWGEPEHTASENHAKVAFSGAMTASDCEASCRSTGARTLRRPGHRSPAPGRSSSR